MDTLGTSVLSIIRRLSPSSEVLTCIQLLAGGTQFARCREVVRSSECPLSEVPLYTHSYNVQYQWKTQSDVHTNAENHMQSSM